MHPNFDRQIANIQQIYGIPQRKKNRLEKMSPTSKSNKRSGPNLDVEGESKPILNKYKKAANIFHVDDPNSDLGIL